MNTNKINLREIAAEYDLQYVETTDQRNGYPSNIMGAIIGMDSFELAEELAKKYNLDIELITKHDGWQLWYRTGNWMNEPLHITEDIFSDDTSLFTSEDADDFFENEVKPLLEDCDDFDAAEEIIANGKKIYEALCALDDNEAAMVIGGEYDQTINTWPMQFRYDTKTDAIALINRNN